MLEPGPPVTLLRYWTRIIVIVGLWAGHSGR